MSTLYRTLTDRSPMQIVEGDITAWGEVVKARRARAGGKRKDHDATAIAKRLDIDPTDVRFIFTVKRGGSVRILCEKDYDSEVTIFRPRADAVIRVIPARERV